MTCLQRLFFPSGSLGLSFCTDWKPESLLLFSLSWPGRLQRPPRSRFHLGLQATLCRPAFLSSQGAPAERKEESALAGGPHLLSAISGLCSPQAHMLSPRPGSGWRDLGAGPPHHREGLGAVAGFSSFWGTQLLGGPCGMSGLTADRSLLTIDGPPFGQLSATRLLP